MSDKLDHYRALLADLEKARESEDGAWEDQILDTMDDAWWELSLEERDQLDREVRGTYTGLIEPT